VMVRGDSQRQTRTLARWAKDGQPLFHLLMLGLRLRVLLCVTLCLIRPYIV